MGFGKESPLSTRKSVEIDVCGGGGGGLPPGPPRPDPRRGARGGGGPPPPTPRGLDRPARQRMHEEMLVTGEGLHCPGHFEQFNRDQELGAVLLEQVHIQK